jgi:hypothetical protein
MKVATFCTPRGTDAAVSSTSACVDVEQQKIESKIQTSVGFRACTENSCQADFKETCQMFK